MRRWLVMMMVVLCAPSAVGYPLYGSEFTGIRRLEQARLAHEGKIPGRKRVPGELLPVQQVDIRLTGRPDMVLPPPDPELTAKVVGLLGEYAERYSVSVLDLSDPDKPRYAEHRGNVPVNPGSVGKLAVVTGLFQALADAYPGDLDKRRAVLHDTVVVADEFIHHDHHTIRIWHPDTLVLERRPLREGDRGSLWEFLDWMLSASSNAAAAMVQKQAMLLTHFGKRYPVSQEEADRFFRETPRQALGALLEQAIQRPLTRNGIDLKSFRQGSFFTATGKRRVPGTSSYATTRELMHFLVRLEQGRIVDAFSSREIKRLLYMTERRIRYASSPALRDSAVYFKSGSLYACQPEPGFKCRKYHGNKRNLMNSVAIIESPAQTRRLYYMVTLTSNVLRRNSAVDHQSFATRIHRLIEGMHAAEPMAPKADEQADPAAGEGSEPGEPPVPAVHPGEPD